MESSDPWQLLKSSARALTDYLIAECADRFTPEMEDRIKAYERGIAMCQGMLTANKPMSMPSLSDAGLEHNYVTAICTVLLGFTHEVATLKEREKLDALEEPLQRLWHSLAQTYTQFFAEPPPFADR